jgi:hypothetical protein
LDNCIVVKDALLIEIGREPPAQISFVLNILDSCFSVTDEPCFPESTSLKLFDPFIRLLWLGLLWRIRKQSSVRHYRELDG